MKKLLTVSLFAIMAVSAANADIASTDYVGKQITATAGTLTSLVTSNKDNLVGAINSLKTYVDDEISTIDEGNGALIDGVANELAAYKTSNDAAVAAAKKAGDDAQADIDAYIESNDAALALKADSADVYTKTDADTKFMDSAEVTAAITSAVTGDNGALKDYVTTEALTQSQNEQDTTLKAYADGKASAAQTAAEATAANALNTYKTSNDAAVAAAKKAGDDAQATASAAVAKSQIGATDEFAITEECKASGAVCSLVVRAGVAGWEKVSY